jgi:multidrug resistance efflux pump
MRRVLALFLVTGSLALTGCTIPGVGVSGDKVDGLVGDELVAVSVPDISGDYHRVLESHPQGRVEAGDVIAQLDSRLLEARADLAAAKLDVVSAEAALSKATSKTSTPKKTSTPATTSTTPNSKEKAKLESTIRSLKSKASKQKSQVSDVKKTITQLQQAQQSTQRTIDKLPHTDQNVELRLSLFAQVKKLTAQLKTFKTSLSRLESSLQKTNASLSTANAKLTKLNAPPATPKKETPAPKDPTPTPTSSSTATSSEKSASADLTLAKYELEQAAITAPVSGQLVRVADPGQVLAAGAQIALIRPDTPQPVTAWVTPAVREQLCVDAKVSITASWLPEAVPGTLVDLGDEARYPPSNVASADVHQLRAFQLTIQTEQSLPAGLAVAIHLPQESNCNG